jgi:hypothetical protein
MTPTLQNHNNNERKEASSLSIDGSIREYMKAFTDLVSDLEAHLFRLGVEGLNTTSGTTQPLSCVDFVLRRANDDG